MKNNIYRLSMFFCLQLCTWVIAEASVNENLLIITEQISAMVKKGKIDKSTIPNPHWNKKRCQACHKDKPRKNRLALKNKTDKLCNNCHTVLKSHVSVHPVNLPVPKRILKNMQGMFLDKLTRKGRVKSLSCLSCHDVIKQCDIKGFDDKQINLMFVRDGPYRTRTGFCYQCHDKQSYQRLNAHDQITDDGKWLNDKCILCHLKVPQQMDAGNKDIELKVKTGYADICLNCHRWTPHPGGDFPFLDKGGPMHLVVPSDRIKRQRKKMMETNQVNLPLEKITGKVYCATCHNPHERGVIKDIRNAKGADEPKRLRARHICENCHDL